LRAGATARKSSSWRVALDWSPRCPIECGPRPRSYALGVLAPVAPTAPAWRSEGGCGRIRSVCYGACGLCAMNRVPSIQGNRRACVPCTMHRPSILVSDIREISRSFSPRCSRPSHTTSRSGSVQRRSGARVRPVTRTEGILGVLGHWSKIPSPAPEAWLCAGRAAPTSQPDADLSVHM
jgi:hypothetical protein